MIEKEKIILELIKEYRYTLDILNTYKIDYSSSKHIPIGTICDRNGIVFEKIQQDFINRHKSLEYDQWSLDALVEHIIHHHHLHLTQQIIRLLRLFNKKNVGFDSDTLIETENICYDLANQLATHIEKKELILYPFIKEMVSVQKTGMLLTFPKFATVTNPIFNIEKEYTAIKSSLEKIDLLLQSLSNTPAFAKPALYLLTKSREIEAVIQHYAFVEQNILHPKTIDLEKKLTW
ncbi:hypothetical protein HN014_19810 [Aquimarina sp. TRL1]|uniref:hemerythrin domain-containing protein n=1 Tax=Aquimarina sp. (strain TRL1) TaxID=2736252 RepID=UPI00158BBC5D|nr:hemerythrin domain-containing protein [Aquimarina sp. TRL1]QKX07063.1 hypothetical protein HN014_19810 [Aquimarina sp. TRL1]